MENIKFEDYSDLELQLLGLRQSCLVSRTQRINEAIDKKVNKIGRGLRRTIGF